MLNMQYKTPNSRIWDYSLVLALEKEMVEGGHHLSDSLPNPTKSRVRGYQEPTACKQHSITGWSVIMNQQLANSTAQHPGSSWINSLQTAQQSIEGHHEPTSCKRHSTTGSSWTNSLQKAWHHKVEGHHEPTAWKQHSIIMNQQLANSTASQVGGLSWTNSLQTAQHHKLEGYHGPTAWKQHSVTSWRVIMDQQLGKSTASGTNSLQTTQHSITGWRVIVNQQLANSTAQRHTVKEVVMD